MGLPLTPCELKMNEKKHAQIIKFTAKSIHCVALHCNADDRSSLDVFVFEFERNQRNEESVY